MLKLAAQPPQDCLASGRHCGAQLTRTSTPASGSLAATLAWTHQSLPLTPLKVASNGRGPVVVELELEPPPGHVTMVASVLEAGIHCRQELRSVAPDVLVARIWTMVP